MAKGSIDEKKTAAASYILNFYKEVNNLNHYYSQYLNAMIELENKYGQKYSDKINDSEKVALMNFIQLCRYTSHKCYIQYKAITGAINQKEDKKVLNAYLKVKTDLVIKREDLENFVVSLNSFLIKDIIQNLLESSQGLVSDIFENEPAE